MRILILGPTDSPFTSIIRKHGNETVNITEPVDVDFLKKNAIDFIVSYGYRYLLRTPVLKFLPDQIINLHISYLPWNRGADPNLWSFLENTPKGVSIHYIDEGIDTGDIIVQKKVFFNLKAETLATSYHKLQNEIVLLFEQIWPEIVNGTNPRKRQNIAGSYHKTSDKKKYEHLLVKGWDTPIIDIMGRAIKTSEKTWG